LFEELSEEALQMLVFMFWFFIVFVIIYGATWVYTHKKARPVQ